MIYDKVAMIMKKGVLFLSVYFLLFTHINIVNISLVLRIFVGTDE